MKVLRRSVVSDSLRPHGLWPARLLCPWNSPGKNPGEGIHAFLQGIFLTQGSNLGLPHHRWILYLLSQRGWIKGRAQGGSWCLIYVCRLAREQVPVSWCLVDPLSHWRGQKRCPRKRNGSLQWGPILIRGWWGGVGLGTHRKYPQCLFNQKLPRVRRELSNDP